MTRRVSNQLFEQIQEHMKNNTFKSYANWNLIQVKFNNLKRKREKAVFNWELKNGIKRSHG
jgi:hypothetical protein